MRRESGQATIVHCVGSNQHQFMISWDKHTPSQFTISQADNIDISE